MRKGHILFRARGGVDPHSICEIFWQKPSIVRDCLVNCSQNCVVSQYGKWSDCTQSCGNATKTRLRRVLVPITEHGEPCPTLSETIPCAGLPLCPSSENFVYTLKVDPWSNCLFSGDVTDGSPPVGSMSRDLHCVRNDGEIVDISFCIDEYMPKRSKPCVPPVDCVLSEWSLWSPCPNVCHQPYGSLPEDVQTYRTRTVTQVPWGRGQLCEELVQYQSCSDVDSTLFPDQAGLDCQREEYVWFASEWSPCQSQESNSATCGAGVQTRDVFCIRVSDVEHLPMPSNLCDISLLPDTIQPCAVHCPVDCVVSSWGPWDHCRANECDQLGVKKAKGYRTRERSVIVGESHGGEACPHLYEHAPCTATECYSWKVGRVGKCRPTNVEQNCGEGLLTQDIQCLNFNQQPVESRWCESIAEMPQWEEPCYHPCPDDCVTSDWGNWSPCSLTCTGKNQGGMQVRYKRILAQPERGGRPCPPESELRDTRPCNDHSCALFAWQTEQWGECILDTSVLLQGCGRGTQQRRVKCDRVMPRKDAPEQRCKPEVKPAGRRSCIVPCPVPCRTSQFTAWSECPTQCYGSGSTLFTQVRSRYILQHPQNTAQSCPSGFHEERVCAGPESCHTYKWVVSSWSSECQIGNNRGPGITCGDGLKTREVQCHRGDDQPVNIDLCLKYGPIQPPTTKPCNIPCEDDCQFNPWSLWSQCLNCDSKQTRTRTPHGSQSECIISELDESLETGVSGMEMDCGRGYQYQAVQCMDGNDVVVPLSYCGEDAAVKKQPCGLPCPTDCQISEWSPWSPCESDNGTKQGRQTRRRELMPPQFGGRPCPLETGDSLFEV
ncbi:putative thrombospondin type-1 domain-containing protein 7A isofor m X2 [Apostichopus japonicus]|uniref:Putative thrombospondin type-1 domain-containing protein 7A isofor m X2 n=1 Tax=Stichopus japonicus TaxID=307972 RepID=A0A2G8L803_STIJA|nr:putative thrombospondin type-1 domain-containing protein 7A isofor m X2 [Apostichopus japonicus]